MRADFHRDWSISFDFPPIPCRDFDWSATSPDYDASYVGPEDGWVASGQCVHGTTREAVIAEIDAAIRAEALDERGALDADLLFDHAAERRAEIADRARDRAEDDALIAADMAGEGRHG